MLESLQIPSCQHSASLMCLTGGVDPQQEGVSPEADEGMLGVVGMGARLPGALGV